MVSKEDYLKEVETQLPKFDADIAQLRNKLASARNVDMTDCSKKVDDLCTRYTILRLRLQVLREKEDDRWEQRRWRIERAIRDLQKSIESVGAWVWVRSAQ